MKLDSVCVWLEKPLFGGYFEKKVFGTPARLEGLFFSAEDPTGARNATSGEGARGSIVWRQETLSAKLPTDSPRLGFLTDFSLSPVRGSLRLEGPGDLEG